MVEQDVTVVKHFRENGIQKLEQPYTENYLDHKKEVILNNMKGRKVYLILLILIIWEWFTLTGKLESYQLPTPQKVVVSGWDLLKGGELFLYVFSSFSRVLTGFLLGTGLALILGTFIALFEAFDDMTKYILQIIKPIPPIAWIPLAILWFGIGEQSKIFIIALGAFFPVLTNTVDGIKNIDARYLELGNLYGISWFGKLKKIVLPAAIKQILTGIKVGASNSWICVVASEMIAANSGVGYMLNNGRSLGRPDLVILGMLIIGIIGKLMDDVLIRAIKKIIVWEK